MHHFLQNSSLLVIPGRECASWGTFDVTPEYYETPYGLVLPTTELSLALIRFLRNYDRLDPASYEWATAENRRFFAHLLNNAGELELVTIDNQLSDEKPYYSVEIVSLPKPTHKWQVHQVSDYVKASVMTQIIEDMTQQAAVQWLDSNSGNRFQKPIPISIENWVKYRADKKLDGVFLQNHFFCRKEPSTNKNKT